MFDALISIHCLCQMTKTKERKKETCEQYGLILMEYYGI